MDALIYFVLWAVVILLMMRFGCGAHVMGHGRRRTDRGGEDARGASGDLRWVPPDEDRDPVCGKAVKTDQAKPSVYDGSVYYFCSRECREAFEAAPQLYRGPPSGPRPKKLEPSNA